MGLLDRILGRGEPEPRVERIKPEELEDWIAERRRELEEGLDKTASPPLKKVPEILKNLRESLRELEGVRMKGDVKQRIKSVVSSSRDNYVRRGKHAVNDVDTEVGTLEQVEELNELLEEMRRVDGKYGQRVSFGFPDQLSDVKKSLNRLVALCEELNSALRERQKKLELLEKAEKEFENAEKRANAIGELEKRESEAEAAIKRARGEKKELEARIAEIEASEKTKKLRAARDGLDKLEKEKKEKETFVLNVLGPLKRVFKKYARAVKEGKAGGVGVGRYADDPVDTFLRGENTLPNLLAKVQKAIQTGVLSLGSGEGEKTLKKIRAINFSYLEKVRSEYNKTVSKIRTLESKTRELDTGREMDKVRREIEGLDGKISVEEKKAGRIREDIRAEKKKLDESNRRLAKKLSEFIGGRCEIA